MLIRISILFLLLGFPSIEAGDFKGIYFESRGRGEPLVLIHGGQLDCRMWDDQFEFLAKNYHVIRYDIRGFGKSPAPTAPYSDSEDLNDLLGHLKPGRPVLVGLSLGAAIAVDFVVKYPGKTRALILTCPGLGGFRFEDPANDFKSILDAARDGDVEKTARLWLSNPYMSVAMEQERLRSRLQILAKDNAHSWLKNPLMLRRVNPPAANRLSEIKVPTLVVGGDRDVSDVQKIGRKLESEITGAKRVEIKGAGHLVPMEKANEFNEVALGFLKQLSQ